MSRMRSWVRCSICRCWFGTHDHAVLHGDGKTDDTAAVRLAFSAGRGLYRGHTYLIKDSVEFPSDPRPDPRTHPEHWTE